MFDAQEILIFIVNDVQWILFLAVLDGQWILFLAMIDEQIGSDWMKNGFFFTKKQIVPWINAFHLI